MGLKLMKYVFMHVVFINLSWNVEVGHVLEDSGAGWAYEYLATKSPYYSRPKTSIHNPILWTAAGSITQGFEPIYVDALYRHGTRYPHHRKQAAWKERFEKLQSYDTETKLNKTLELWDKYFPPQYSCALHRKGWFEMGVLAESLFQKTSQIFNHIFDDEKRDTGSSFLIYSSPKARVLTSAKAFLTRLKCIAENQSNREKQILCSRFHETKVILNSKLSEGETVTYGGFPVIVNRDLLRTFDLCDKYAFSVDRNSSSEQQFQDFFKTNVFLKMSSEVSDYFKMALDGTDVVSLYRTCSFVLAMYDKPTVCNLFSKQHLQILEYASDLKHFYKTGYGYKINYQLGCRLLKDIITKLDNASDAVHTTDPLSKTKTNLFKKLDFEQSDHTPWSVAYLPEEDRQHTAVLRFGHAETLIPLLCLLGLYKDKVPLTANTYERHKEHRLFRTGTFSPFAANIAFVLYKAKATKTLWNMKLAVIINEYMIKIPVDGGCHFCDFEKARLWLISSMNDFDCETVCQDSFIHDEF